MRFSGPLNVDINEITMNLVPFPRLKYLLACTAPTSDPNKGNKNNRLDQIFSDAFSRDAQLMKVTTDSSLYAKFIANILLGL
jgi:tubulin epsilon